MKYINSFKFKNLFEQILNSDYNDLNDYLWELLKEEGWIDDASRKNHGISGYKISDYEFIELKIPEFDEFGLITFDDDIIEKYNEFDIELKEKLYDKGYNDFIDYENGKVYIIKLK